MYDNGRTSDVVKGPTPEELAVHERFQNLLALERAIRDMLRSQDEIERLLETLEPTGAALKPLSERGLALVG